MHYFTKKHYEPKINIRWTTYFNSYIHLPPVTIDVCITIELLEEDKKLTGRYVVLVKGYRIVEFMSA